MSFLTSTKLIGKRLKPTDYQQYIAEISLLFLLGSVYLGIDGLSGICSHAAIAAVPRDSFALIGAIGLYAIRLSSFVAMIRNYRTPQIVEWWMFLVPTAAMILCFCFPARWRKPMLGLTTIVSVIGRPNGQLATFLLLRLSRAPRFPGKPSRTDRGGCPLTGFGAAQSPNRDHPPG